MTNDCRVGRWSGALGKVKEDARLCHHAVWSGKQARANLQPLKFS